MSLVCLHFNLAIIECEQPNRDLYNFDGRLLCYATEEYQQLKEAFLQGITPPIPTRTNSLSNQQVLLRVSDIYM